MLHNGLDEHWETSLVYNTLKCIFMNVHNKNLIHGFMSRQDVKFQFQLHEYNLYVVWSNILSFLKEQSILERCSC